MQTTGVTQSSPQQGDANSLTESMEWLRPNGTTRLAPGWGSSSRSLRRKGVQQSDSGTTQAERVDRKKICFPKARCEGEWQLQKNTIQHWAMSMSRRIVYLPPGGPQKSPLVILSKFGTRQKIILGLSITRLIVLRLLQSGQARVWHTAGRSQAAKENLPVVHGHHGPAAVG